jgi:predicted nucleic acid-binding protein
MILSADANLFLYAANPDSPHHETAHRFFEEEASGKQRFLLCGLVLVELYMQLRNPAVFKKPKTAKEATAFCDALRANPAWEFGDYEPEVAKPLWNWAAKTTNGFRHIIDARVALRSVRAMRGAAAQRTYRVALHSEARELAEHGRD